MPGASIPRAVLAGLAGGLIWILSLFVVFGPAQRILQDPARQSEKMLAAFAGTPPPRMAEAMWIVPVGLLVIGIGFGLAYHLVVPAMPRGIAASGRRFGLLLWLIAIPWFEFYLPWNVLREPASLALLELACWFVTMQLVGHGIVFAYHAGRRRAK